MTLLKLHPGLYLANIPRWIHSLRKQPLGTCYLWVLCLGLSAGETGAVHHNLHPLKSLVLNGSGLILKDPVVGKDWGQEEKGTTEDELVGWHHRLDGHGFRWTPGVGDGQGGLVCCGSWGCKESDMTERLNWTLGIEKSIGFGLTQTWVWIPAVQFRGNHMTSPTHNFHTNEMG